MSNPGSGLDTYTGNTDTINVSPPDTGLIQPQPPPEVPETPDENEENEEEEHEEESS